MRPALLTLLIALATAGTAIMVFVVAHFAMVLSAGDWAAVEGRVLSHSRTWNTSIKWHSGFCSRVQYVYRDATGEHIGSGLKPGLFQESCTSTATVQGQLLSELKVGQPVQVFVDLRNQAPVLDRSSLVLVPLLFALLVIGVVVICIRGIVVVWRERDASSNRTFERDARESSARPSP